MCLQAFGDPVDPELFEPDAPAQDQPTVQVGGVEPVRVGELLLLHLEVVRKADRVVGARFAHVVEHPLAVAVRRPTELDGNVAAEGLHRHRGRQPVGQHLTSGGRGGVDALVRPTSLVDHLDGDPAVGLHPRQDAVDLLVGRVPEEAEGLLEAMGELEAGRRSLTECDEESVLEGHGAKCAIPMQLVARWDAGVMLWPMTYELGQGTGPLRGVKVVEIAGIGPGPHACMILADLGADVIRVERPGGGMFGGGSADVLTRGRPSVALDLKRPEAVATVLDLVAQADVLVEGMRPGAIERLGLGPNPCWERNPALVYGRMTGWGQDGPWSQVAGHDMNYIAITGALHGLGQDESRPHFPGNLLGDFGGGSTYLVIGVLAGLLEARLSGQGQVVDAAIVDGTAHLNAMAATFEALGMASGGRRSGLLDGGTPYYDLYETADGQHLSLGALEPQFWDEMVRLLGVELPDRNDPANFPALRQALTDRFKEKTQAEWAEIFDGTDACVAPILPLAEAYKHPHLVARSTFVESAGITQPAPAPRFSRTVSSITMPPGGPGAHTRDALAAWGVDGIDALIDTGAAVQS